MFRMRGWRGVLAAMLGLIAFETLIGSQQGPAHFKGMLATFENWTKRILDPAVPAITAQPKTSSSSGGGGGGGILGSIPGGSLIPYLLPGLPTVNVPGIGTVSDTTSASSAGGGTDAISAWITSGLDTGASSSSSLPPTSSFPGASGGSGSFNPATATAAPTPSSDVQLV